MLTKRSAASGDENEVHEVFRAVVRGSFSKAPREKLLQHGFKYPSTPVSIVSVARTLLGRFSNHDGDADDKVD